MLLCAYNSALNLYIKQNDFKLSLEMHLTEYLCWENGVIIYSSVSETSSQNTSLLSLRSFSQKE